MDIEQIKQKLQENESIIKIYCMSLSSFNQQANMHNNHTLKLFAKQLNVLKKCDRQIHSNLFQTHPSLLQWLKLLSISPMSVANITSKNITFHDMYNVKTEVDLHALLERNGVTCEESEVTSIFASFVNLKKFESFMANKATNNEESGESAAKSDRNDENAQIANNKHMNLSNPNVDNLSVKSANYSSQNHLQTDSVSPKSNAKSASKKPKVPTPPPSRKLSTHAPAAVPLITNKSNSSNFTDVLHHQANTAANHVEQKQAPTDILINDVLVNASNMQRSTSHESHLRNKVHHGTTNFADAFPKEQALIIQKINENIYDRQQKNRTNSTEVCIIFFEFIGSFKRISQHKSCMKNLFGALVL
jgi:hypothetical protein